MTVKVAYLTLGIIGIITAIPLIGDTVDFFKVLTFILLSFSIYILVKGRTEQFKKTGAILMIISCCLSLIGAIVFFAAVGSSVEVGSKLTDTQAMDAIDSLVGGGLISMVFSFPAWVLKIIAIVFSFIEYNKQKVK
ncbi:hypothetical protein JWS92_001943 [Enterococcus faecalis]|nr:hypothetical protein [Enterococcus faecalis]